MRHHGALADVAVQDGGDLEPGVEEKRALLERVASSPQLRRSARLRDFLLYVGTQSLKEGCPEIHEHEIGAKVFGRDPSYDRSQDNIVRVNATELRKRIEQYFATDGAHEPLVLEIPRGGYKPVFYKRIAEAVEPALQDVANASFATTEPQHGKEAFEPASAPTGRRIPIYWLGAVALLAVVCGLLVQQNITMRRQLSPWDGKPAVEAFWTGFLHYHEQVDLVLPDDSVSVIEDLVHHPVSLEDYLSRDYIRQIQASDASPDRKTDLDQIDSHNLITFGGMHAAQQIMLQIPSSPVPHLTLSRYYTADAMKHNSVIVIGGKKANPWVHLFDNQMNFVTDYDYTAGHAFIANLHPKQGEQATYAVLHYPDSLVGYSVVAYLPSPSGTGNAIVLAGTDSDATNAAAEFLSSEEQLEAFRSTLHVKKFPYFEVLLKTSRLSGTSFKSELVSYRTYASLP